MLRASKCRPTKSTEEIYYFASFDTYHAFLTVYLCEMQVNLKAPVRENFKFYRANITTSHAHRAGATKSE